MKLTEQDKELLEQVEAIFKNPHCESCHEDWDYDSSYRTDSCCTRFMTDSISKVVALITADRKRVELEARLDEARYIDANIIGTPRKVNTNDAINRRIAELKVQQEEV